MISEATTGPYADYVQSLTLAISSIGLYHRPGAGIASTALARIRSLLPCRSISR